MKAETSVNRSVRAAVALIAAGAASVGDVLLLWVSGGGERAWLPAAHYLGVLCIPLYALGYHVVARGLDVRAIFWVGLYASAVGTAIHGMTAVAILEGPVAASSGDRFASLAPVLTYLIPLWLLVGALTVVGSVLQFRAVRADARHPQWFAWANPLAFVVLVGGIGALSGGLWPYVIPAAPNLAHVLYFVAVAAMVSRPPP